MSSSFKWLKLSTIRRLSVRNIKGFLLIKKLQKTNNFEFFYCTLEDDVSYRRVSECFTALDGMLCE